MNFKLGLWSSTALTIAVILKLRTYQELGSLMFNIDLLGYGLMSLSTIFVAPTLVGRGKLERLLKTTLASPTRRISLASIT
jgi:hypothetical protein